MTDKMKEEELLNILETAFSCLLKDINYKETGARYEQSKEQIVALIKLSRQKSRQNGEIQKPGVTEEWIIEKACEDSRNFVCSLVEEIP